MKMIQEKAYAKLNLTLDVLNKRSDGYHNMETIFQTVSVYDTVEIHVYEGNGISVQSNYGFLPNDKTNLAWRAADYFFKRSGLLNYGAGIILNKTIPVCAGMGGGSSDAAAVLRALNRFFDVPVSWTELLHESECLGADVPFCLLGGTALGRGKGELLEPIKISDECAFVIVKPKFSVSTPELFKRLDGCRMRLHPYTEDAVNSLMCGDWKKVGHCLYNVFEDVLPRGREVVEEIKNCLIEQGAFGSCMTGTGSATFGIFSDLASAQKAAGVLSKKWHYTYVAEPVSALINTF